MTMQIFKSTLLATVFVASIFILKSWNYPQVDSLRIEDDAEIHRRERSLKKGGKGKCNEKKIGKLFTCLDGNGDDVITLAEILDQKKCLKKYKKSANIEFFLECLDMNKDLEVSSEEAFEKACECVNA